MPQSEHAPMPEKEDPEELVEITEASPADPAIRAKGAFARRDWDERDDHKSTPVKTDKGWFAKSERAQARELQRIMGTYRPQANDPIPERASRNGIRNPGSLKDYHESEKVRRSGTQADAILKANQVPEMPSKPAPPPEPVVGYCWECHKALPRYGIRADTKFCQDNGGKCSRQYRNREANRAILNAAFEESRAKADTIARYPGFPDLEPPFYFDPPAPEPTAPMSASYAARTNRVSEFLAERKQALIQDNRHKP